MAAQSYGDNIPCLSTASTIADVAAGVLTVAAEPVVATAEAMVA